MAMMLRGCNQCWNIGKETDCMHLLNFVILWGGVKEARDAQKAMIKRQTVRLAARNRQGYLQ